MFNIRQSLLHPNLLTIQYNRTIMQSMKLMQPITLLTFLFTLSLWSATPVPYSGKIDIRGVNYFGGAQFAFSLHDGNGTTHWRNGNQPKETIKVTIRNGRYTVLLGGQGMNSLAPELFLNHDKLYLKVEVDMEDGEGLRHLAPDQLITATPRALVAEVAKVAKVAEKVGNGAITLDMLSSEVLSQLDDNATANPSAPVTITRDMLPASVLNDLNKSVIITRGMLPQDVLADLNKTVTITRSMLPADVLSDLNRTISKSMLGSDVLADLNKSSTTSSPITLSMLAPEVTAKLDSNASGSTTINNPPAVGSLIAVPYGSEAPAGYSLYQRGEPKALVWEEKAPVSVARLGGDGVEAINGRLYFAGGKNSSAQSRTFEYYRESTNEWSALSELSEDRDGASSVILDNKLYLIGGRSESSVKQYNLHTDTWSTVASLPEGIRHADAVEFNNRIFLIGGINDSDQRLNKVFEFLPNSNQWLEKENMPSARLGLKLVVLDGKIWAIGGNDGSHTRKVEIYNPIQNSWTSGPTLLNQRNAPVTWVQNGRIYVGGGFSSNFGYQDSIEVYDPALRKWIHFGNFPEPKYYADSVILNDTVYVVAGFTGNNIFSNKVFAADLNASMEGVYDLYRKDGNASAGTPLVQAEVADGSVTTAKIASNTITTSDLSEQILKYLKPEITIQPQAQTVYADTNGTISVSAEGKYLSYQWKKNGVNLAGETNATLSITDANASQHDGNYSVVVRNDFGSVESEDMQVVISFWTPSVITALKLWLDANDTSSITLGSGKVSAWNDKSGNSKNATQSAGSARPTFLTNSVSFDGVDDKLEFPALGLSGDASVVFAFNVLSDDGYSVFTGSGSDHWDRFNVDQRSYPGHFRSLRIETLSLNFPTSGEQILAYLADSAGPKYEIRLNGSNVFQSTDSFSFADNIGILGGNGATAFKGAIMEVVVIDDYSTEVVQRLEGYLAGKWGLLNNLPNDHPYR